MSHESSAKEVTAVLGRWDNRILVLLLAVFLARGVIYLAVIPPWQAPDEPKHFEYVNLLYQERRLLSQKDVSPSKSGSSIRCGSITIGNMGTPIVLKVPLDPLLM